MHKDINANRRHYNLCRADAKLKYNLRAHQNVSHRQIYKHLQNVRLDDTLHDSAYYHSYFDVWFA